MFYLACVIWHKMHPGGPRLHVQTVLKTAVIHLFHASFWSSRDQQYDSEDSILKSSLKGFIVEHEVFQLAEALITRLSAILCLWLQDDR